MKNVLIINGHSNMEQSNANKVILEEVQKLLPDVRVRHLSKLYPDSPINVAEEQKHLEQADIIVWQFPVHWYSLPAILKKWLDETFTFGFAFGVENTKLIGKKLILSFTTGSPEEAYNYGQAQNYPFTDFLNTHRQTANLCKLDFQEPVISYGMSYIPCAHPEEVLTQVQQKAKAHAERLVQQIKNL